MISTTFYEGSWEQSRLAGTVQRSFVPAIFSFLVHVNDVTDAQLQFIFAVRRVRRNAAEPMIQVVNQ